MNFKEEYKVIEKREISGYDKQITVSSITSGRQTDLYIPDDSFNWIKLGDIIQFEIVKCNPEGNILDIDDIHSGGSECYSRWNGL
jgi:hypothetical protein